MFCSRSPLSYALPGFPSTRQVRLDVYKRQGENDEDEGDEPETNPQPDENSELDIPEVLEYDEPVGKSGPKNLLAFHEQTLDAEAKKGRGRPKKVPSGFDKPLHQGNSEF